jgi:hypothetical protein
MQIVTALQSLPWSLKILWGITSDNLAIGGSQRKTYIIIASILSSISMLMASIYRGDNWKFFFGCVLCQSFSQAFSNVVIDAILIV